MASHGETHIDLLRICKRCEREAYSEDDLLLFVPCSQSKHGYKNICKICANKRNSEHPKKNDWKTDHQTKKRYGIDRETYLGRMASSSCCEICGSKEELCYDHDHTTMAFRGVLCRACNRSIGQLGDTAEGLEKALAYLRKESNAQAH